MAAQPRRIGPQAVTLDDMLPSWERSLDAENKSPHTIRSYTDSVRALARHAGDRATTDIGTDDVRAFLAAELARISAASVAVHFRNLRVFFGWLAAEEPSLILASPMTELETLPWSPGSANRRWRTANLRALLANLQAGHIRQPARRGDPAGADGHRDAPRGPGQGCPVPPPMCS